MAKLTIEQCPETGICSILKADGARVDLMPDEAEKIKQAAGDTTSIKTVLAQVDQNFADSLNPDELDELASEIK